MQSPKCPLPSGRRVLRPELLDSGIEFVETAAMPRLIRILVLCVAAVCSSFAAEETEYLHVSSLSGPRGGHIVAAVTSDPSSFNQMFASGLANLMITDRLSADLVHVNRSTLQLEPSLAKSWQVDDSGKNYTIRLRRGVRFSDGSPFTADDVVFSFQVLTDPKAGCTMAGQLEIDGAFPTVTRVDDFTVQLSFPRPVGMGLRMLDSIPMLPRKHLLRHYKEGRIATAWGPGANPAEIAGLGAFRLKEYRRGVKVVLERNPYYWKKDRSGQTIPYLDTLTFLIIPDVNSEALRFRSGELDLISSPSLNPASYATLRRLSDRYVLKDLGPGLTMDFLWFNLNKDLSLRDPEKAALFERVEFRTAVSHALDRAGMVRSILLGLGVPQYGPVSSGNKAWYHAGITKTEYNPGRAKQLLAKIGLRDSNGDGILEYGTKRRPLEITLLTARGNSTREKGAQVIQDNLSKVGIRVSIQHLLPQELAARFLSAFDYEAILFGITPTDVAPDLQTNLWYSSGNIHFWHPAQKKPHRQWEASIDALITQLVRSTDQRLRKSSFDQAQNVWVEQMPAIPTIAPNVLVGWSRRVLNVRPSILAPHLVWNAEELAVRN